jgi:class 3 adenylate cyclase/tetratricopeptide (TPR) repeat protein
MDLQDGVDPEEWHGIMDRFFQILADGVHRFEGTVNQYTGDGVMALFGAPIAHEDHAQRACYSALHLTDALRSYANDLRLGKGLNFSVRMGLNSGEVIVGKIGDDLRMDYTAQGHTVGLAARIEQLAEPGKAYVTERTADLVKGYFQLGDLGPLQIKGVQEPIGVYELEGVGALRTRLEVSRVRGYSRFVGRAEEMHLLESALSRAEQGNSQIIGIVGEAGLGKSRLCAEFLERCRARGIMTYETTGVAHGKSVPLLPILTLFRAFFGITDKDSSATARERIAGRLVLLDESLRDALPVMFDFLGVADPEGPAPTQDPDARQRQLFAVVRGVIRARAERETTVLLLEDLHWFDGGSEAFLEPLLDLPPGARTLALVNFRPEYQASRLQKSSYQQVPLLPLGLEAITELLRDLLGDDPSLERLPELIRERTGGNPFFIEEVVLSLAEAGILEGEKGTYRTGKPIEELRIPPTVQGILGARIDRLGERDKRVLQTASVIGKKFPETVLRRIAELPDDDLLDALRMLQGAEFVYEEALYPETEYAFKHPLTQEVAYETQLRERRARVHAAVARVVEDLYGDKIEEQAALLAYHWELAGEPATAVIWHCRAAEWAGVNEASEARRHWDRVRALVAELPAEPQSISLGARACSELLTIGWRLGASEEEAAQIFEEGKALAGRSGELALLSRVKGAYGALRGLAGSAVDYVRHTREAAKLAEQVGDPELALAMNSYHAYSLLFAGSSPELIQHCERALRGSPEGVKLGTQFTGYSPYLGLLQALSWAQGSSGQIGASQETAARAVQLARDHQELEVLAWIQALQHPAFWTGDPSSVLEAAREAWTAAEKFGSAQTRSAAACGLGNAHTMRGEWDEAVSESERGIGLCREARVNLLLLPYYQAVLALALAGRGETDRALTNAEEAIALARGSGTLEYECMGEIVFARILLAAFDRSEAERIEAALSRATELVEQTGARLYVPWIHRERAALASKLGDPKGWRRELGIAHQLFEEMGLVVPAKEVAEELAS